MPVLWTIRRKVTVPGLETVWDAGLNSAVIPVVSGMLRAAEAPPWMAGLLVEVAMAMRLRFPCTAKLTAPVLIGTT